ncbi:hypothetical protein [Campylobacter magnus]|uniref:Uncharacterized protein n=1 Tax=Campylobacter magnus TaxID=3026462 RepID=A0ABT8T7N5_9BACT|nr:hypothetical protein [Campylobacter magnus]MDO2409521.1 hypothetical protein [Campylobacter magnus]
MRPCEAEAKFSRNKRGKSAKFQRSVLKLKSCRRSPRIRNSWQGDGFLV